MAICLLVQFSSENSKLCDGRDYILLVYQLCPNRTLFRSGFLSLSWQLPIVGTVLFIAECLAAPLTSTC